MRSFRKASLELLRDTGRWVSWLYNIIECFCFHRKTQIQYLGEKESGKRLTVVGSDLQIYLSAEGPNNHLNTTLAVLFLSVTKLIFLAHLTKIPFLPIFMSYVFNDISQWYYYYFHQTTHLPMVGEGVDARELPKLSLLIKPFMTPLFRADFDDSPQRASIKLVNSCLKRNYKISLECRY